MKKHIKIAAFAVALGSAGVAYAMSRLGVEFGLGPAPTGPLVIVESTGSHIATPEMRTAAHSLESRDAPSFRAEASDGNGYSLRDIAKEVPLALVFIKDGCPCSIAAAPFFGRLHTAYGDRVRFFGVIDGGPSVAQRWAKANHAPFPILCDPKLELVHEYKAENSAYFALITRGGTIDRCWPGYSVGMLDEANAALARLAGVEAKPIDAVGAPLEMYTGCPY